jgi:ribosome maturation factor RimP
VSVAERLWDRIGPYLAAEDVELDDLEVLGGGKIVRVTVDAEESLGIDRIAELSRAVSRLIDEEDPFSGSYTLEVSSPGLERKLRLPRHFEKAVGRTAKVKTHTPIDGDKTHTGTIVANDDDGFRLDVEGAEYQIAYSQVASAHTVFVWEKAGRSGKDS